MSTSAGTPLPSQTELRATFSRPSSRAPPEAAKENEVVLITELLNSGGQSSTTFPAANATKTATERTPSCQPPTDDPEPVLITQLDEDEDEADERQLPNQSEGSIETSSAASRKPKRVDTPEKSRQTDIFDGSDWDTDLEDEEIVDDVGPPFRGLYKTICDNCQCSPASYFIRHIEDKELNMKYHGFSTHECEALAKTLKSVMCIETLDLEGNWVRHVGCRHLCRMLEENDTIHQINLAENKLGVEGMVHVIRMMRQNKSLLTLSVAQNDLDDHCGVILADCLAEDSRLKRLDLSRNSFGEETACALGPAIAANEYMETLDLSWNKIRHQGATAIAKGLKESMRLKELNLSWNGLGEVGGNALADALIINSTITDLNISSNRLTPAVCQKFVKTIGANETLIILAMANNPISTNGAITLITAVKNSPNSCLEMLDLSDNPVEFEFMKVKDELKSTNPDFQVKYGSLMRSGNTQQDLGKRGLDPGGKNEKPVLLLEENLLVNNSRRLLELLSKHNDTENIENGVCSPDKLIFCLKIMDPSLNSKLLTAAVNNIPLNKNHLIMYRQIFEKASRTPRLPEL